MIADCLRIVVMEEPVALALLVYLLVLNVLLALFRPEKLPGKGRKNISADKKGQPESDESTEGIDLTVRDNTGRESLRK